jgi:anti-sigma regulatory factor (Ser/Thr protein kinase)
MAEAVSMSLDARMELEGTVESPAAARGFLRRVLDAWDCEDPDEIAVLLTSEVVSNAVVHAATRMALDVCWDDEAQMLRVEVRDGDVRPPRHRHPSVDAVGGRGIMLVESLARRWGSEPRGEGKIVWFELSARRRLRQLRT